MHVGMSVGICAWDRKTSREFSSHVTWTGSQGMLSCAGREVLGLRWQHPISCSLPQQTSTFSQFWRVDVQDEGASRAGFLWGLSPWLADGHPLAASSPGPFSAHLDSWCLFVCPDLLLAGHCTDWVRALLEDACYRNHLVKGPISKCSHILG